MKKAFTGKQEMESITISEKTITAGDIARQLDICERVADILAARGRRPLAMVDTYGCQQNEADSEKLRGMLEQMGCAFTTDEFEADLIVVNTCAVREHAEMRILGNVGALNHSKKANPDQVVVLCGCMVQQAHMAEKIKKSFRLVDLVFGTHELWRFPELLHRVLTEKKRVFEVSPSAGRLDEGLPLRRDSGVRAWLPIMYGCNNFCTYCVVPHVRGRERSRDPERIVEEARALVGQGYKELTLLGQNVNSYGLDLGGQVDFADLIRRINDIPGDFFIRFMTSHPKDATDKLFQTMADCEKCESHIHLPVQSGSSRILKAMNRGYDRDGYLALVEKARALMPDIVITTDIIVGFPGETDEDFADTLSLVERVGFDAMFTFIYSKREGTPAATMEDPFTREDKQRRFDALLALANRISEEKHAAYVGQTLKVLVDGRTEDETHNLSARTQGGRLVHLRGDEALIGGFAKAKITDSRTWALFGEATE